MYALRLYCSVAPPVWPGVFVKKSPNDHEKSPKKSPKFFDKFNEYSLFNGELFMKNMLQKAFWAKIVALLRWSFGDFLKT
jgi:hypothetical protein